MRYPVAFLMVCLFAGGLTAAEKRSERRLDREHSVRDGVERLMRDTGRTTKISMNEGTGTARFIRFEPGSARLAVPRTAPAEEKSRAFLREYGSVFGIEDVDAELRAISTRQDAFGGKHVIFKQGHRGVPVFGGEIRAHFDRFGQMTAINGTFVSGLKVTTTANLSADVAGAIAVRTVLRQQIASIPEMQVDAAGGFNEEDFDDLTAVATTLMVFHEGLVKGVSGTDYLAYEVEVANAAVTIREFVYVDANDGKVIDQITGIYHALDREVSETSLANVIWDESNGDPTTIPAGWAGGTAQQVAAWQDEVDGAGETHNLFSSMTAGVYDSYDGAGATMRTINNASFVSCPNATWNGTSTNYCNGVTGDDTVAHEWGHAYTDYTNGLIYAWQSGALNESYSDIWGEVVDLLNGRGTDAPDVPRSAGSCSIYGQGAPSVDDSYRWLSGEDDPAFGGAIRDLWQPECYNDPGKVTSGSYWCSTVDGGGVHTNSGVPNHAFALMVDGGTYNGYTITGLGLTKTAHIHWSAQNLLTAASNFGDQADALEAACSSLIGVNLPALSTSSPNAGPSGIMISAADCSEVADVNAAVEFRTAPSQCNFVTLLDPDAPALCEGLGSVQTNFFEDFENGSLPAGWNATAHDVVNPGTFQNPGWSVVNGLPAGAGSSFAAFAPDLDVGNCTSVIEAGAVALDSPAIVLPAGQVPQLAFDHWVATETGWDGGNVKVKVNGGPWTVVPAGAHSFNAYNGAINGGGNDNPLADEEAFTGADGGSNSGSWGQSQVDLFGLAFPGDTVQLRFDLGVDGCAGVVGWYVDDVHVYSCAGKALPICGDGELVLGEQCDDGNMANGDGCSSSCEVEDGWLCSDPTSGADSTNVVADWSFEGGVPNADWTAFSTFGGIAEFPLCGPGNGCPAASLANTGDWLVWIGGLSGGVTSSVEQIVTIPASATEMTVQTLRGICDDPSDTLHVSLDGTDIGTIACDVTDGGWVEQSFPVAPFNDGGSHILLIGGTVGGTNGTHSNFFVEDVIIEDNVPTPPAPSVCTEIVEDLACNAGTVAWDDGIGGSWTVVDNEGTGVVWTDIASSGIGGNFTGGTGEAASANSDANIFTEFDTELRSNSFDLSNASEATLDYLVNYQNLAALDFLDVDISTDGGSSWTTLLSWNEDHPVGGLFSAPGEAVSVDLAAYLGESDVQVRWHYYDPNFGDWDWYAQVDNVALTCNLIPDCAGATASPDMLWSPNHKFAAIDVLVTDPDGDPVTVTIDSIFQDEKVKGPGKHHPDGKGIGTSTAEVRAERDGKGDGRVYHIGFTADDGKGGMCNGVVLVGVPHDQGGANDPVDGGPNYDSTTP